MRARLRVALLLAALVALIVAMHDVASPPSRAIGAHAALFAIDGYRAHVSPHLRGVVHCRFRPSCSAYGREAIAKYGLLKGGAMTTWRVLRCNPLTADGTVDRP